MFFPQHFIHRGWRVFLAHHWSYRSRWSRVYVQGDKQRRRNYTQRRTDRHHTRCVTSLARHACNPFCTVSVLLCLRIVDACSLVSSFYARAYAMFFLILPSLSKSCALMRRQCRFPTLCVYRELFPKGTFMHLPERKGYHSQITVFSVSRIELFLTLLATPPLAFITFSTTWSGKTYHYRNNNLSFSSEYQRTCV